MPDRRQQLREAASSVREIVTDRAREAVDEAGRDPVRDQRTARRERARIEARQSAAQEARQEALQEIRDEFRDVRKRRVKAQIKTQAQDELLREQLQADRARMEQTRAEARREAIAEAADERIDRAETEIRDRVERRFGLDDNGQVAGPPSAPDPGAMFGLGGGQQGGNPFGPAPALESRETDSSDNRDDQARETQPAVGPFGDPFGSDGGFF